MQTYAILIVFMALVTSLTTSITAHAQSRRADPQDVQRLREGIAEDQARLARLRKETAYEESSERLRLSERKARALKLPDGRLAFAGANGGYVDQNGRKLSRAEIAGLPKRPPNYSSMNAGVVLERMNPDQLAGFIQGLGQMLAYRLLQEGKTDKAVCVQNYSLGREKTYLNLGAYRYFLENTNFRAEYLVYLLANGACDLE